MEKPKDFATAEAVEKWLRKQKPTEKGKEQAKLVQQEPELGQDVISPTAEGLLQGFFQVLEAIPAFREAAEKIRSRRFFGSQASREFEMGGSIWCVEYYPNKDSYISVLRQDVEPPEKGTELVDGEQMRVIAGRRLNTRSSILYRASDVFVDWRDWGHGLRFVTNKPIVVSKSWGLLAKLMHASSKEAAV